MVDEKKLMIPQFPQKFVCIIRLYPQSVHCYIIISLGLKITQIINGLNS